MTLDAKKLGQRLREAREAAGLTQQQVADWIGIRRPGIVEMESGARAVKSDELARLAALYGRSIPWLVQGETGPEDRIATALFRAGDRADPSLQREAARLARRCHLTFEMEERLGLDRPRSRLPQYIDDDALDDWSIALEHGRQVAYQERSRLQIGPSAPLGDVWGIIEDAGLHVFPLHLGEKNGIDGIFARGFDGKACVGVNVDKWVFRQIFTAVHEFGHALMDSDLSAEACMTDRAWVRDSAPHRYKNRELRANQFAAVFLVPRETLLWYLDARGKLTGDRRSGPSAADLTPVDIVRAQDHFGVSADMLLWRLRNERLIDASERQRLRTEIDHVGLTNIARALGYDWRTRAQPFGRAREVALHAYARGFASLGTLAEIFGNSKEEMHALLHVWGVTQEITDTDPLIGGAA